MSNAQSAQSHSACVLWLTGLSGSGKSSVAAQLQRELQQLHCHTYLLDGDFLRQGLCNDLGFSVEDRIENIRRVGEVAKLMMEAGFMVICATISPFQAMRDTVRARFAPDKFVEIFVDAPLAICEERDPKGLYVKARSGEIREFTGIDSAYDTPQNPEIHLLTDQQSLQECVMQVLNYLVEKNYLCRRSSALVNCC